MAMTSHRPKAEPFQFTVLQLHDATGQKDGGTGVLLQAQLKEYKDWADAIIALFVLVTQYALLA